jgi:hypothetical protein
MPKAIRVPTHGLGWNVSLSDGFSLGTLPSGGYGILWYSGPAGLGQWTYWLRWEPPHNPVWIEYKGQEFIFCRETATEAEIGKAPRQDFEEQMEGR